MRHLLPLLLLTAALLTAGCDSNDSPAEESDAVFRVEVTDAQGDAVEGLRVGVRPCVVESCDPGDVFSAPPAASSESSRSNETQPVMLDFFEAEAEGRDVDVTWRTTSETNNWGFEVQMRSGEDQPFTQVGFVESKAAGGTTDDPQDYALQVPGLHPGTYTFQLVQVDLDGATTTYDDQRDDATVELQEEFLLEGPYPTSRFGQPSGSPPRTSSTSPSKCRTWPARLCRRFSMRRWKTESKTFPTSRKRIRPTASTAS